MLLSICLCITIIFSIPIIQYFTVAKTAQNLVATHLVKKYNTSAQAGDKFMCFDDVYYIVKLEGLSYVIELSGSTKVGIGKKFNRDFYAKARISLYTNNAVLEKCTFGDTKTVK